jgi:tetrahydrodipicolinate N-succinyltransferase
VGVNVAVGCGVSVGDGVEIGVFVGISVGPDASVTWVANRAAAISVASVLSSFWELLQATRNKEMKTHQAISFLLNMATPAAYDQYVKGSWQAVGELLYGMIPFTTI